ncbi:MAG: NAD(P)/FAD-dependent oxidoreductase [Defluviitaleaceae bacterium]|nr:NAD(P)/FAD-dependent oxidoreductase [Defluviitaleaceae bacterium]
MFDVAIIGCGIVGAAAAYELSKYELSLVTLEKENDVAASGATKANSATIHAGYDPRPGTLMARLNVEGAALTKELCRNLDIPHKQCGALVLAFSDSEVPTLERLLANGIANGVPGMKMISGAEALRVEPNINPGIFAALQVPTTMIVSPWEFTHALAETSVRNGADLRLNSNVTSITREGSAYIIHTADGEVRTRRIINAAGLYADHIHNMVAVPEFEILPDRGEYYLLDKSEGTRVSQVIYQCPNELGKGVLVAPTVHGNLIAGPSNATRSTRDDTSNTYQGLSNVKSAAGKSVPSIDFRASIRNFAGIRARTDQYDFIIGHAKGAEGFINLAGIKSPGLSAAPAIAKMAADLLAEIGLDMRRKQNFINERKRVRFHDLSQNEKAALIAKDPAYGQVICRCETVTEGEIRDALASPIPPRSLDGVKRRTGPGMGRCQGGFCSPRVLEILARHYGVSPIEIPQDTEGTYILTSETKGGAAR